MVPIRADLAFSTPRSVPPALCQPPFLPIASFSRTPAEHMSESLVLRPNTREIAALWRPVGPHRSSTFIFLTCSSSFSLAFTNHRMLFDSSPRYPASLKAQTTKGGSSMLLSRIYTQLFSTIYTFACRQWYRQHSRITLISRDKHHCNSSPPSPPPISLLRCFSFEILTLD